MEQLEEEIGLPHYIHCDNGPEFTSKVFIQWCHNKTIEIKHTQPGKPMQNGFIERFNRFYREDILDAYFFKDLQRLRILSENWRVDYNLNHPHNSLGKKSPKEFMPRFGDQLKLITKSERNNNYLSNLEVS